MAKTLLASVGIASAILSVAPAFAGPGVPPGFCRGETADGTPYQVYIVKHAANTWHADAWLAAVRRAQKTVCGAATF